MTSWTGPEWTSVDPNSEEEWIVESVLKWHAVDSEMERTIYWTEVYYGPKWTEVDLTGPLSALN